MTCGPATSVTGTEFCHCKSFRRLKQKTQVFLSPEGDHYRTRLTHTLEVSQIARTIARALRLNRGTLTEAISPGPRPGGHTPYGHAGERALTRQCPGGLYPLPPEPAGGGLAWKRTARGLNLSLSWEVRNGIVCPHQRRLGPARWEGRLRAAIADHIAFMNHDIEDAVAAGVLRAPPALPREIADAGAGRHQIPAHHRTHHRPGGRTAQAAGAGKLQFSRESRMAYGALKDFHVRRRCYVDEVAKARRENKWTRNDRGAV